MNALENLLNTARSVQSSIHEHWCGDGDCDECVMLCEAIALASVADPYQRSVSDPSKAENEPGAA